jgi:hypothetical protein
VQPGSVPWHSLKPATGTPAGGALGDPARTKAELVAENALLWQQLIAFRR